MLRIRRRQAKPCLADADADPTIRAMEMRYPASAQLETLEPVHDLSAHEQYALWQARAGTIRPWRSTAKCARWLRKVKVMQANMRKFQAVAASSRAQTLLSSSCARSMASKF